MQVEIKYVCSVILGPLRSGPYEIPEGSKISDLLKTGLAKHPGRSYEDVKDMLIFLRNGKPALPDTALNEGDNVHMLLKVFGG